MVDSNAIKDLTDDIMTIVPLLLKKVHKLQSAIICNRGISYTQVRVLFLLKKEGMMSMSGLGTKLEILKPNVTAFVDKLIEQDLVERVPQDNDRRLILVKLTDAGAAFIEEFMIYAKDMIRGRIEKLEEADIEMLQSIATQAKYLINKFRGKAS